MFLGLGTSSNWEQGLLCLTGLINVESYKVKKK